tara:strand:+ start:7867 stop:8319 length:453 start_codon:yes stop_codon:yes gene_type:complete
MKEMFLNYQLALQLKELGFNEECVATYRNHYNEDEPKLYSELEHFLAFNEVIDINQKDTVIVPTNDQVIEWLITKGFHIELLVDGYLNEKESETLVSDEFICYRLYIYRVGEEKPGVGEDFGASSRLKMLKIAFEHCLFTLIEENKSLTN